MSGVSSEEAAAKYRKLNKQRAIDSVKRKIKDVVDVQVVKPSKASSSSNEIPTIPPPPSVASAKKSRKAEAPKKEKVPEKAEEIVEESPEEEQEEAEEDHGLSLSANAPQDLPALKNRVLVFSSRGTTSRFRHLMEDIRSMLPHCRTESKYDQKNLFGINDIAELNHCNWTLFFDSRKERDLYLWMAKNEDGPSAKFLVSNIHTMAELQLTGNCLKGSRPLLHFDSNFDTMPHLAVLKEMFTQTFACPPGHPKMKPFIDHIISFYFCDNHIWFRNFQIVEKLEGKKVVEKVLVEIGPRMVLQPVKIFESSFSGKTLYENPMYVSPSVVRRQMKKAASSGYAKKVERKNKHAEHFERIQSAPNPIDNVFSEADALAKKEEGEEDEEFMDAEDGEEYDEDEEGDFDDEEGDEEDDGEEEGSDEEEYDDDE